MKVQNRTEMKPTETIQKITCPECGAPMTEVERVRENGFFFIWYECSRQNCNGQWLERESVLSPKRNPKTEHNQPADIVPYYNEYGGVL
jgi:hypothetical protein